ncbi:MAG: S8 family serine peptidase [Bacteroidota bacterium]
MLKGIKLLIFIQFLAIYGQKILAQNQIGKYLVKFKDKAGNTFSIDKPQDFLSKRAIDRRANQGIKITNHDLPPTKSYIDELKKAGATVWYQSRWYNGALILADSATALKIKSLSFVMGFENNLPLNLDGAGNLRKQSKFDIKLDTVNYGSGSVQARMMGTHNLHNAGFKGKGMLIAVLDDGFNRIDKNSYLKHLFEENKVLGTYDFVRNTKNVYDIGGHGNLVLSTIASNTEGKFVGTAPEASFVLLRTEDAPTEKLIEEANYLFAAEYADSSGVDVINTSLGYVDFDYAGYTHSRQDLDGDKTLVTKAADWAAAAGILVCVSAGNSGENGIGAPSDGDSVLAIGSVDKNEIKSGFSSVGPSGDGRIKPDLSAMGSSTFINSVNASTGETQLFTGSGTSFASPIFAGFATCFWQANPSLKVMEVHQALKNLGSQATKPDNRIGYGIPKYNVLVILAEEKNADLGLKIFPNPSTNLLKIDLPQNWKNKKYSLQIFNQSGLTVFSKNLLVNNYEIDITIYPTGTYFGKISHEAENLNFKFLKY